MGGARLRFKRHNYVIAEFSRAAWQRQTWFVKCSSGMTSSLAGVCWKSCRKVGESLALLWSEKFTENAPEWRLMRLARKPYRDELDSESGSQVLAKRLLVRKKLLLQGKCSFTSMKWSDLLICCSANLRCTYRPMSSHITRPCQVYFISFLTLEGLKRVTIFPWNRKTQMGGQIGFRTSSRALFEIHFVSAPKLLNQ